MQVDQPDTIHVGQVLSASSAMHLKRQHCWECLISTNRRYWGQIAVPGPACVDGPVGQHLVLPLFYSFCPGLLAHSVLPGH
jgi:hypothetical protein